MVFTAGEAAQPDQPIDLPCGKCEGCRFDKSRDWGLRCYHESLLYDQSGFITLTYDDDHLPTDGLLAPDHLRQFIKDARELLGVQKLRYFSCGEYGEETRRPHYHLITFGLDWRSEKDKVVNMDGGFNAHLLQEIWDKGHNTCYNLSPGGCFYVAGYETKKKGDPDTFTSMSRNIAKVWVEENWHEMLVTGCARIADRQYPVPNKYLEWMPEWAAQELRERRQRAAQGSYLDKQQSRYAKNSEFKSPWRQPKGQV